MSTKKESKTSKSRAKTLAAKVISSYENATYFLFLKSFNGDSPVGFEEKAVEQVRKNMEYNKKHSSSASVKVLEKEYSMGQLRSHVTQSLIEKKKLPKNMTPQQITDLYMEQLNEIGRHSNNEDVGMYFPLANIFGTARSISLFLISAIENKIRNENNEKNDTELAQMLNKLRKDLQNRLIGELELNIKEIVSMAVSLQDIIQKEPENIEFLYVKSAFRNEESMVDAIYNYVYENDQKYVTTTFAEFIPKKSKKDEKSKHSELANPTTLIKLAFTSGAIKSIEFTEVNKEQKISANAQEEGEDESGYHFATNKLLPHASKSSNAIPNNGREADIFHSACEKLALYSYVFPIKAVPNISKKAVSVPGNSLLSAFIAKMANTQKARKSKKSTEPVQSKSYTQLFKGEAFFDLLTISETEAKEGKPRKINVPTIEHNKFQRVVKGLSISSEERNLIDNYLTEFNASDGENVALDERTKGAFAKFLLYSLGVQNASIDKRGFKENYERCLDLLREETQDPAFPQYEAEDINSSNIDNKRQISKKRGGSVLSFEEEQQEEE